MTASYDNYLQSDYWKQVSDAVKKRDGYKCRVCNSPHDLQAHHRDYSHRGKELDHLGDLTTLCRRCHGIFHGKTDQPVPDLAFADAVPQPVQEKYVLVTPETCHLLSCTKEPWQWMVAAGINPRKKGWAKRAIGHSVPVRWMRGAGRKNCH